MSLIASCLFRALSILTGSVRNTFSLACTGVRYFENPSLSD
jgi:hypothetical protein